MKSIEQELTKILNIKIGEGANASVTPIYQCSAFTAGSPYFYSRKNNPNVSEFEEIVSILEGAKYALAVSTGMTALYAVLELLCPGDVLVINKDIYGCSYKLFQRVCQQRKITLIVLDCSCLKNLKRIPKNTKMIIFETPTNPFLKTIDIQKVSKAIKAINSKAIVVVDNTWATPLFQKPLKHGADISIHSCTKYFSGHSDVMGGVILVNRDDLYEEIRNIRFYGGLILTPFSSWLLRRSVQTFGVRMKHHENTAKKLVNFLKKMKGVKRVYYPKIDRKQMFGYGGIIFFELREDLIKKYKAFTKALKLFGTGTGMACVTSMVAQPYTGSHASLTREEKKAMGLNESLVRLCFGLEDIEEIKNDIAQAFAVIDP